MATSWSPDTWRSKPVVQLPDFPDKTALEDVEAQLATFPPPGIRRRGAQFEKPSCGRVKR